MFQPHTAVCVTLIGLEFQCYTCATHLGVPVVSGYLMRAFDKHGSKFTYTRIRLEAPLHDLRTTFLDERLIVIGHPRRGGPKGVLIKSTHMDNSAIS